LFSALAVILVLLGGLAFWLIGVEFDRSGPTEAFWQSFLTVTGVGSIDDQGWPVSLASFTLSLARVFFVASLFALLVTAVNKRLDALRRGHGRVLEEGHTVILGSSPRLTPVIDELLAAGGTRPVSVVVLADRDKQVMEDDFRATHPGKDRKRVQFRSGDPSKRSDLEMVAVDQSDSVIVLSEGSHVDAIAVQRALAAQDVAPETSNVVAEMRNQRVARSLRSSTSKAVVTVEVSRVVADMLAQAIRTDGLARVFDELLSFGGNELYVCNPGSAAGRSFAEVACGAAGLVVLGILAADGTISIPNRNGVIGDQDQLVVLAESEPDENVPFALPADPIELPADPLAHPPAHRAPLSVVVIGWSSVGELTLDLLDGYLPTGSSVEILADMSLYPRGTPEWKWSFRGRFVPTKHEPEQILRAINRARADAVAVLGYSDGMSETEADALTLLTHLMLQQNRQRIGEVRIVTHLFDSRLRSLAKAENADDFVVTDALASRMLAHVSRHPSLGDVYADLFDPKGPIVDVIPGPPTPTNYGVTAAGIVAQGMVPIGTIINRKVSLNPSRSSWPEFGRDDRIVVVQPGGRGSSAPGNPTA
jgi:voltage-gated potassium channel Kch